MAAARWRLDAGELDGEEIAGDAAAYSRLDLLPGGVLQAVIDRHSLIGNSGE